MDFPAQHRTKIHSTNPLVAVEQGGETPRRCRRHIPQRRLNYSTNRCCAARGQRRMAASAPLHADRGYGRTHTAPDRRRSTPTLHRSSLTGGHLIHTPNFHHVDGRDRFEGVPRSLGVDAKGRDVLSWIEGEVPGELSAAYGDAILAIAAGFIRRYHDATAPLLAAPSAVSACKFARNTDPLRGGFRVQI